MIVKQNLSILFFQSRKEQEKKDGKAPVYVRLTIDGLNDTISTGRMVHPDHWGIDNKNVSGSEPDYKKINKELRQILLKIL